MFNVVLGIFGMIVNGMSIYHVVANFDFKKSLFQLLILDGFMSALSCLTQFVVSILFLIGFQGELECNIFLVASNIFIYHGLVVTFEMACIR